jgi:5-methylthioadenosine/S-adenosylhomocysteine deaminase
MVSQSSINNQQRILKPDLVIPVDAERSVLKSHSVVIETGRITAVLPHDRAITDYPEAEVVELDNQVLLPGLINAHTHAAMSLFRGIADDLPLMTWLNDHIWPAESKWVNPQFVEDGTELAIAEMLLSGTTCFNDMYFFPDVTARTAQKLGMRAVVGLIVIDFPTIWASDADEYISKGMQVHDEARSMPLISTAFAPHAPYTVSDAPLEQIRTFADELNIPIHMHVHETAQEVNDAKQANGVSPVERLNELGLLTPKMIAVHMTQLSDNEIELLAASGTHIAHCPQSNLKLASGFCPTHKLEQAGINIALGTDSAASNNDLDMLSEMQTAALVSKVVSGNAEAIPAYQAIEMATINGAKALNLDNEIGSIEVGKAADLISIDLNHPSMQPVYDPAAQIVYSASRQLVKNVWTNGRRMVENGALTNIDTKRLIAQSKRWGEKIQAS